MPKPRKPAADVTDTIAGFTPAMWKKHMDTDEDWTERLEGAPEASVREVVDALGHTSAEVSGLACNLVYALGVTGLGTHVSEAIVRLATLRDGDRQAKVRSRAKIVHESLAGEVERAAIRRALPWLAAFDPAAVPAATRALDDGSDAARLQVYLWWANTEGLDANARASALEALETRAATEVEPLLKQAAAIAMGRVRG